MHSLLRRQLRRFFGVAEPPAQLAEFLEAVDRAYHEFDDDRRMLERSLDLSSGELLQANAEMRAVLRAFPDLFFRLGSDGMIRDCRGGSPEDFSVSPDRLIGKRIQDIPFPEVARAYEDAVRRAIESRTPVSIEYQLEQDGQPAIFEARLLKSREDEIIAVVRNITERKMAEDLAVRQRSFLRQVIDLNPNFIFAKDREGRFTLVNHAVAEAYGTTVEDLLGRTDAEFSSNPEEVERFRRDDLAVLDSGLEMLIPEEKITDANGRLRWLQSIKRAITGPDGRHLYVLGVSTDITARRQAEESLRKRTDILLRKQAVLEGLARMTAPDLGDALDALTAAAARALQVERVSVWLFDDEGRSISCAHLCVDGAAARLGELQFLASDYPCYFEAVRESRAVAAADARTDPRTSEFAATYFEANGVTSVLDVPVRAHGKLVGLMSHEHTAGPREWTLEEIDLAASIADFISLHIEADRRRGLEHQLRQSQKMEAVGLLAGGVAHDFNNLLSVIGGYAELARDGLPPEHPITADLDNVLTATRKAADLTKKLLAFSRKQVLRMEAVDARAVLEDFSKLLSRIVGEDVDVVIRKPATPLPVMADRSQLDQLLLNLCTNARQAMPRGGRLEIVLGRVWVDEEQARSRGLRSHGAHVELRVTDHGVGMPREVLERLWEPFFTTKETGTGLGLAVVYGIVEQHHGVITVESEVGVGSTFSVLFPSARDALASEHAAAASHPLQGTEKLLVVEDEPMLRQLLVTRLERLGYHVVEAANGEEAIAKIETEPDIALAIMDVVMPRMSGPDAYRRMVELHPGLAAVFASGYAPEDSRLQELLENSPEIVFVPKPFVMDVLYRTIRELLDLGHANSRHAQPAY